jgi:hypothetical protein
MNITKYLLALGILLGALLTVQAQTTTTNANGDVTTIPAEPASLSGVTASTNWVVIPYGIYDTTDKKWGWGAAGLYEVTPIFYTGARVDFVNGQQDTAGVQANLQISGTWHGITYTPFLTTSAGIGRSTLYGSAGAGAVIVVYQKHFKVSSQDFNLNLGVAADYEHVVNQDRNYNQICGGPLLQLTF